MNRIASTMRTKRIALGILVALVLATASALSAAPPAGKNRNNHIEYHGGPIMTGTPAAYFIWYGDWNGNTAVNILTDFITTVGGSPYNNINTTYDNADGNRPSGGIIYGGSFSDLYSRGPSLSDSDVAGIVANAINSSGLPLDPNGIYFVLGSADVNATALGSELCQFHDHTEIFGTSVKYAYIGNPERFPQQCAPQFVGKHGRLLDSPNGNLGADAMASWMAHVLSGVVTDPEGNGWYDNRLQENSDKCQSHFGQTYTAANGAPANVKFGLRDYLIQENWVNASGGYCALASP